jgi:hypothetical protein
MVSQNIIFIFLSSAMLFFLSTTPNSAAQAQNRSPPTYSPAQNGYLGLNTTPSDLATV